MKHDDAVIGALFAADGRRILSWSDDKTLRLWDAATGAPIGEPMKHDDGVRGALFAADGRRILSWSQDKTLRLWDAATGAASCRGLLTRRCACGTRRRARRSASR